MQGVEPSTTRTQADEWFISSYSAMTEHIYEVHPHLFVFDAHTLMDELAAKVPTCPCESRDDFLRWAEQFVTERVREVERTERLLAECRKVLRAAIHKHWPTHTVDYAVDAEDLHSEIAALVHKYAGSLDKPGRAKLTTRVFGLVKTHMRNVNTKRNRRMVLMAKHLASGGDVTGAALPEILAAEKAQEAVENAAL